MPRDSTATRKKILDAAYALVLRKGFAATSVEEILAGAGVSRGTFFYHYPTKDDMARELIRRHAREDGELADEFLARAERLSRDPLQQVLIMIGLYIEMFEEIEGYTPGCLFASYSYEAGLFDDETHAIIHGAFVYWRELVGAKLDEAMLLRPPRIEATGAELADLGYGIFEGGLLMARVLGRVSAIPDQLRHFRSYLELLFDTVPRADMVQEAAGA